MPAVPRAPQLPGTLIGDPEPDPSPARTTPCTTVSGIVRSGVAPRCIVSMGTRTYTNTIGEALLGAHWTDPDFDPKASAFYYVRVLEIPTPRHSLYDAAALGLDPDRAPAAREIQERAYSSPVWFRPEGAAAG